MTKWVANPPYFSAASYDSLVDQNDDRQRPLVADENSQTLLYFLLTGECGFV